MIVALAGGVGGAKLAQGLALALEPGELTVVINTADDVELYGLHISPDLDTVMYTLGGIANPVTGWGILGDTKNVQDAIAGYGRNIWFQLGDRDFATHILRTERLRSGASLTEITAELSTGLGIASTLLPMTDDPVATKIQTKDALLDFQDYFVARQQSDDVLGIIFDGAAVAKPSVPALHAIAEADMIVICPSNPLVSVGPILAVDGFRAALEQRSVPAVAVSPIIGGKALKGPADKMMATLGHEVSALGVARMYVGLIDGIVIDETDAELTPAIKALGIRVRATQTIMGDPDDRRRLADEVLAFGRSLSRIEAQV